MRSQEKLKGKFITFEGCEGSGKSTQLKMLSAHLEREGIDYIMTREPGGSPIAEEIRAIILDSKNTAMCDECEAMLYAASRIQHLREKVIPALEAGKLVICDRYVDSSLAYQGFARGLGLEYVADINKKAFELGTPDLTVFLNISPEKAFERKHGADENDRMERQGLEFHNRVYEGYLRLLQKYPRICAVESSGTAEEMHRGIVNLLKERGII